VWRMGWVGQAAFAVVGGFWPGLVAGFLIAGYRQVPSSGPWAGLGSARRVSAWPPASRGRTAGAEPHAAPGRVTVAAGVGVVPMAAAGRQRSGGPGAAGCGRPGPARSSGRPAQGGGAVGSSSRGSAWRSGRCVPGRTGGHRPATSGPGRAGRGRPTTAIAPWVGACGRGSAGPGRGGWCRARSVAAAGCRGRVALLGGMQPAPGLDGDRAVLVVLTGQGGAWVGQVVGSAQANLARWRRGRPPLAERAAGGGSA
jgi:hypothetical protein